MKTVCLHDKNEIEALLRQNTFLHLYSLGDLDNFFWQHTTWYGLKEDTLKQIVLLYTGSFLPVLLGLTAEPINLMADLLQSIIHLLPRQFYAHLSGNLADVFAENYQIQSHGLHHKMALTNPKLLENFDTSEIIQLSANADEIEDLYRVSYPENWFDPRMLETGYYYGIRREKRLVSIAGVHVYSQQYKVAALGNITTHPRFRKQGLSKSVVARLCKELLKTVNHVGLNVKADNVIAIACYEKLGFEGIATYKECLFSAKYTNIF